MAKKIFVNLPVKDLNKSTTFFKQLGFTFNPDFSDENAACMIVSDDILVMLLTEPFFRFFTKKDISDATKTTEVIVSLSADSKAEVDNIIAQALAAGATSSKEAMDQGFMYQNGFEDLDGHLWEFVYMDPTAVPQG
ncbi:VOC family protein [Chitinophaga nivalis]|uniref:VOC family protein n=1 Tax=Chitinophaga nivalis TaxID=2991709 RepID=A0ABT3IPE8_9BACT|nr:VOC family protein [Chitinophaga nivalis]MCW3464543.1 VOC family protein [Chitinophaga nivalis]MCW3485766.1 VOC family protein [Chitinophaga nivalis]